MVDFVRQRSRRLRERGTAFRPSPGSDGVKSTSSLISMVLSIRKHSVVYHSCSVVCVWHGKGVIITTKIAITQSTGIRNWNSIRVSKTVSHVHFRIAFEGFEPKSFSCIAAISRKKRRASKESPREFFNLLIFGVTQTLHVHGWVLDNSRARPSQAG